MSKGLIRLMQKYMKQGKKLSAAKAFYSYKIEPGTGRSRFDPAELFDRTGMKPPSGRTFRSLVDRSRQGSVAPKLSKKPVEIKQDPKYLYKGMGFDPNKPEFPGRYIFLSPRLEAALQYINGVRHTRYRNPEFLGTFLKDEVLGPYGYPPVYTPHLSKIFNHERADKLKSFNQSFRAKRPLDSKPDYQAVADMDYTSMRDALVDLYKQRAGKFYRVQDFVTHGNPYFNVLRGKPVRYAQALKYKNRLPGATEGAEYYW